MGEAREHAVQTRQMCVDLQEVALISIIIKFKTTGTVTHKAG